MPWPRPSVTNRKRLLTLGRIRTSTPRPRNDNNEFSEATPMAGISSQFVCRGESEHPREKHGRRTSICLLLRSRGKQSRGNKTTRMNNDTHATLTAFGLTESVFESAANTLRTKAPNIHV